MVSSEKSTITNGQVRIERVKANIKPVLLEFGLVTSTGVAHCNSSGYEP